MLSCFIFNAIVLYFYFARALFLFLKHRALFFKAPCFIFKAYSALLYFYSITGRVPPLEYFPVRVRVARTPTSTCTRLKCCVPWFVELYVNWNQQNEQLWGMVCVCRNKTSSHTIYTSLFIFSVISLLDHSSTVPLPGVLRTWYCAVSPPRSIIGLNKLFCNNIKYNYY